MLGRKHNLGKTGFQTYEPVAGNFDVFLIDSEVEVGLLAGEL
jgi:hypothetical protein